jgi:hypothetical protein
MSRCRWAATGRRWWSGGHRGAGPAPAVPVARPAGVRYARAAPDGDRVAWGRAAGQPISDPVVRRVVWGRAAGQPVSDPVVRRVVWDPAAD